RRAVVRRKLVGHPVRRLAEVFDARHASLFVELALCRRARVFVCVDATLRHLPFEAGIDHLRPVVLEAPRDQHAAGRIEQRDADVRTIGLGHFTRCAKASTTRRYTSRLNGITRSGRLLIGSQRHSTNSGSWPPAGVRISISLSSPVKPSAYHFCVWPRYFPFQACLATSGGKS